MIDRARCRRPSRRTKQLGMAGFLGLAGLTFLAVLMSSCASPPEYIAPSASPGSERMARRLAVMVENSSPMQNEFMNGERLALLRRQQLTGDVAERAKAEIRLASELLRAGESAEAVDRFAGLLALAEKHPETLGPVFQRAVRSSLAIAHLRLGEQQNCIDRHTSDACLLPIQEGGVHRLQDGSRAAMEELAFLLRDDGDDLTSRWLLNLAAMTVGDYPDAVPPQWLIPERAFASDFDLGRFPDVASQVGLASLGLAGGSVLEDLDGDGHLDAMVSSWGLRDPLRLLRNRGDGTFEEVSEGAGLDGITGGLNLIHADYDNDGDADILVLRGAWLGPVGAHPNSLLENRGVDSQGRLRFEDVTEAVGLLSFHPTQTAAWGDFDNDGWLDLYIGNESLPGLSHPAELYRNNGLGEDGSVTFTNVARQAGVEAGGYIKGVAWGDVDNDGWSDLYVSRLLARNLLFRNEGAAGQMTFREIGQQAGVDQPIQSFPTWFFDYDNDGWLDIFTSGYMKSYVEGRADDVAADYLGLPIHMERPRLYHNEGKGADGDVSFVDVTTEAGLDRALLAMGSNFGDLDNDGFLDFYLGTGAPDFRAMVPNRMFRNAGGRFFQDVTTSGGFGHLQKGHGVSFGDIDSDGDQDILLVVGGAYSGDTFPNVLFLNPGHGHHWVTLRLEGVTTNRSAIGARLRLELETPEEMRQVHAVVGSGGSFGSSSLQQEIGLGDAMSIRTLEIRWPGGPVDILHDLPVDRLLRIREGGQWAVEILR